MDLLRSSFEWARTGDLSQTRQLRLLLEHGADVERFNDNGQTALEAAVFRSATDIVTMLLRRARTRTPILDQLAKWRSSSTCRPCWRAQHGREAFKTHCLTASLGQERRLGHRLRSAVGLEDTVGGGTAGVHDTLRYALVIEVVIFSLLRADVPSVAPGVAFSSRLAAAVWLRPTLGRAAVRESRPATSAERKGRGGPTGGQVSGVVVLVGGGGG